MYLLLLIITIVMGGYMMFKALHRNKLRKQMLAREEFQETLFENSHAHPHSQSSLQVAEARKIDHDPLFEDYAQNKPSITKIESVEIIDIKDKKDIKYQESEEAEEIEGTEQDEIEAEEHSAEDQTQGNFQEFISFTIVPKQQTNHFAGHLLAAALKKNHFYYGKQKIFHRHYSDSPTQPILYSVASLVEPGFFKTESMLNGTYPGIVIFMKFPCKVDSVTTFEKMLTSARQISAVLNGDLCDEKRNVLTAQTIQYYRSSIKEASFKKA